MYKILCLILLVSLAACADKTAEDLKPAPPKAPAKLIGTTEYIDNSIKIWQQNGVSVYFRSSKTPLNLSLQFRAGSSYGKAPAVAVLSAEMLAVAANLTIENATINSKINREFAYLNLVNNADKTNLINNIHKLAAVINNPPLAKADIIKLQQQTRSLDVIGTLAYNGEFAREITGGAKLKQVLRLQLRRFIELYFNKNNLQILLTGDITQPEAEQLINILLSNLKSGSAAEKLTPQFAEVKAPAKVIGSAKPKILLAARAKALNLTELGALYYLGELVAANNNNFALEQQGMNILYAFNLDKPSTKPVDKIYITNYLAKVLGAALRTAKAPVVDAKFWQQALEFAAQNNWDLPQLREFYKGFNFDAIALAKIWHRYLPVWRVQQVGL